MALQRINLQVLITVKTYPIPSKKYDELVCTAGVTAGGDFIRLYPINFRELEYEQQYVKYQWISVDAEKHSARDSRKESYRPHCDTLQALGEPIKTRGGDWSKRAKYVLRCSSQSMEELWDRQEEDRTSLGIFRPREIRELKITEDTSEWPPHFRQALQQQRLFEWRDVTLVPPRKVPFKFHYLFSCDDARCQGHKMMIEDWEVGRLFWRLVDQGGEHRAAAEKVREKFFHDLCGPDKETYFYVGTVLAHPKSWVVIGLFYPKKGTLGPVPPQPGLFDI